MSIRYCGKYIKIKKYYNLVSKFIERFTTLHIEDSVKPYFFNRHIITIVIKIKNNYIVWLNRVSNRSAAKYMTVNLNYNNKRSRKRTTKNIY